MTPVLAHFTVQDLPGTLAILVAGIAIGSALASRAPLGRATWGCFATTALLAVVAAGADYDPLFVSITDAAGGKTVIDALWLGSALLAAGLGAVRISRERRTGLTTQR